MRSFSFSLDESVRLGLANGYAGKDAVGLEKAYGYYFDGKELKPTPTYNAYPDILSGAQIFSWTPEKAIAILSNAVYLVKHIDGDLITYLLIGSNDIDATIPFTFVGYEDKWFAFSGEYVLSGNDVNYDVYQGGVMCGCEHKGKLVLGGIGVSNNSFATALSYLSNINDTFQFAENSIIWSSIGTTDSFDILFNDTMLDADASIYPHVLQGKLLDLMEIGEFGYMPMQSKSTVMAVLPLGNMLIVYQESAITMLQAVDTELVSTYGIVRTLPFGILSSLCVANCETYHTFVNSEGELFTIALDGSINKHDFSIYFKDIAIPIVTYDKVNDLVHIKGDDESYIFKSGLLFQSFVSSTSIVRIDNIMYAHNEGIYKFLVKTLGLTFKESDFKTITNVQIIGDINKLYATCYYSVNNNKPVPAKKVPVNPQGYAFVRCAGTTLQLELSSSEFCRLDSVRVEFQIDGKRYRRGINVN